MILLVKLPNVTPNQSKHSGKNVLDSLISQKDHFSSVFTTFAASFFLAEDLHRPKWIANVRSVKFNLLRRSLWKLWRCLVEIRLFSKGILFNFFWSHAVRHFIIYELYSDYVVIISRSKWNHAAAEEVVISYTCKQIELKFFLCCCPIKLNSNGEIPM